MFDKYKKYATLIGSSITFDGKTLVLDELMGIGGNSVVFGCSYLDSKYVIKFFVGNRIKRYKRFKSEVNKINYINSFIEGITPKIIESNFPKYNARLFNSLKVDSSPFFIMERGEKFNYNNLSFEEKLNKIIEICECLNKNHKLNVQHRDIKPENIVYYQGKLSYIDYGTASVPGFETIDSSEPMGSRGTMAPEMVNRSFPQAGYKNEFSDIYSLGKTMWIILTNDRNAHKFTTYDSSNISSKIIIPEIHDGIVMALERIIKGATKENYLERLSLEQILSSLILIRDGLLGNEANCNIMKYKCLLADLFNSKYDVITITDNSKCLEFIKCISKLGIMLSLEENNMFLCDTSKIDVFSIFVDSRGFYYFVLNDIKYLFKVESIFIYGDKIKFKTQLLDDISSDDKNIKFTDIDSFIKRSVLTNQIGLTAQNIYLECDVCLNIVE